MNSVLITGAAGGLGVDVTSVFLQNGWHVQAVCRSEIQSENLRTQCVDYGDNLSVCTADLTLEEHAKHCVETVRYPLRAFVHLVGGYAGGSPVEETPVETLEAMLTAHVRTTFLMMQAVLPELKKRGGSIVTFGAKPVLHPTPNKAAYALAKAAVASLTQSVAEEGKPYGVRANCILPDIIVTPANLSWGSPEDIKKWTRPEDIASAILFLCSDAAAGINGALLPMFGQLPA
jgi:3-oxoacyl-[acyl-carrier protein] reductase